MIPPNLLDIEAPYLETFSAKILKRALNGSLRDIIFLTPLLKYTSKLPYAHDFVPFDCFYLKKVKKPLSTFKPTYHPLGLHVYEFKKENIEINNIKGTGLLFYDRIEESLYRSNYKFDLNITPFSISAIGNDTFYYTWDVKSIDLPNNLLWAMAYLTKTDCYGFTFNGKYYPNVLYMLNKQYISEQITNTTGLERLYLLNRYKTLIDAFSFFRIFMNEGKIKARFEKRLKQHNFLMRYVTLHKDISSVIDISKLVRDVDYKLEKNHMYLKLGVVILLLLERNLERKLCLKPDFTLSFLTNFNIGDYYIDYHLNKKHMRLIVNISRSPLYIGDEFLSFTYTFKITKLKNRLVLLYE